MVAQLVCKRWKGLADKFPELLSGGVGGLGAGSSPAAHSIWREGFLRGDAGTPEGVLYRPTRLPLPARLAADPCFELQRPDRCVCMCPT